MTRTDNRSPGILTSIVRVIRLNRLPCLLLNLLVIALVGSYYWLPSVAGAWEALGAFKLRWSYAFSLASTVFAAALMPSFVQWTMGTLPPGRRARRLALQVLFWGYRGMEIDLFYHLQTFLFGPGNDALTLIKKVALDQFVVSPLWFVPTYTLALRWIEMDGSWARTRATLNRAFWTRTCVTVLVTNWLIWIPALALVYSLPPALQFPLFSVVMCFFILIVTLLARHAPEQKSQDSAPAHTPASSP